MSESNRLSQLLSKMRQESIQNAIKTARTISKPCGNECLDSSANFLDSTPLESDLLAYNVKKMILITGNTVPAESSRIQAIISATLNNSMDQFNPLTRFAHYAPRLLPPVCPVVPLVDRNANLPKASTACPLPNKFYFPTIR
jgi:hypothetical protein